MDVVVTDIVRIISPPPVYLRLLRISWLNINEIVLRFLALFD